MTSSYPSWFPDNGICMRSWEVPKTKVSEIKETQVTEVVHAPEITPVTHIPHVTEVEVAQVENTEVTQVVQTAKVPHVTDVTDVPPEAPQINEAAEEVPEVTEVLEAEEVIVILEKTAPSSIQEQTPNVDVTDSDELSNSAFKNEEILSNVLQKLNSMVVADLKVLCKQNSLSVSGKKKLIINRIYKLYQKDPKAAHELSSKSL